MNGFEDERSNGFVKTSADESSFEEVILFVGFQTRAPEEDEVEQLGRQGLESGRGRVVDVHGVGCVHCVHGGGFERL